MRNGSAAAARDLRRVHPPAEEHHGNNAQDCQQDRQTASLGEVQQHGSEGSPVGRRSVLIGR